MNTQICLIYLQLESFQKEMFRKMKLMCNYNKSIIKYHSEKDDQSFSEVAGLTMQDSDSKKFECFLNQINRFECPRIECYITNKSQKFNFSQ